ncbi:thymus-specific serine protease-like [Anopheles funestus]|uniref:thymus-specific serine protease-like n=1 Tax=Anopheles funestus TaxID=62324 RepID=UPI0020C6BE3E|nr:thymus-specific serine protease-like [Anopheles funestus]
MKGSLPLLVAIATVVLCSELAHGMLREAWFETRVDHFNSRNQDKFAMRYYINDEHAYARGPIFVVVGAAGPIQTRWITEGLFYDTAYLEGAYLFANELRYFGHSLPVENAETENLDFLNADQALADLAEWITYLRQTYVNNPNAKVILMGTAYGGALATWFRQKYPHLVSGVWVSSGAIEADFAFASYNVALGESIRQYGSDTCYSTIWSGFRVAQNMAHLGLADLLSTEFHLCEPLDTDNELEVRAFLLGLRDDIEFEMLHLRNTNSIREMCEDMDQQRDSSLNALIDWFAREHQYEQCVHMNFDSYMERYVETDFNTASLQAGHRQRLYLQCTEEGFFPTTSESEDQPFGNMIGPDFFVQVCQRAFGEWLTEDVIFKQLRSTNTRFGGLEPAIERAHFTNGGVDPYRVGSPLEDLNPKTPATLIPHTFVAPDLESIDYEYDSEELIAAKERTRTLIDVWIFEDFEPIHA